MTGRYVTDLDHKGRFEGLLESTPLDDGMEDPEQYRLYRLCPCENCNGTGKSDHYERGAGVKTTRRCGVCRGEGRSLELVATCGTPEAVGVALVTLASEGEWDECPFGLMHRPEGQTGKWLLKPWLPSTRNVTDAAKLLRAQR